MSLNNKENIEFKELVSRLTEDNNSNISNEQKMANIRILGHALQAQSIQSRHENAATCALLDQYLEQYHELTFCESRNTIATYREIWNDLSIDHINANNWSSNIDLNSFNFDDCDTCSGLGVSDSDLKNAITKNYNSIRPTSPLFEVTPPSPLIESTPASPRILANNEKPIPTNKTHTPPFRPKKATTSAQNTTPQYPSTTTIETEEKLKKEFKTGLEEYHIQNLLKRKDPSTSQGQQLGYIKPIQITKKDEPQAQDYGTTRKYLGSRLTAKFIPPVRQNLQETSSTPAEETEPVDEKLKNIDPKMIELIKSEIMDNSSPVSWNDIAGLKYAKTIIQEAVILPILRPDIFTGLRRPPRGILLFGPPGTGKTLLGKCIASQSKSTFFSISASSLTSKWIGDGEKMVRALFTVASVHQPAVVFIDEIDSLLCQRSESEHESSRRLKTEFLVQLDGVGTGEDDQILIIGATNRPQELDEAARRRLVKRLYIPLPELEARVQILKNLIKTERHSLTASEINHIGESTEGYSGADMKTLCHEASMGPIRSIPLSQMEIIDTSDVRPLNVTDFLNALNRVKASVSPNDLDQYVKWDKMYGSGGASLIGF